MGVKKTIFFDIKTQQHQAIKSSRYLTYTHTFYKKKTNIGRSMYIDIIRQIPWHYVGPTADNSNCCDLEIDGR